MLRFLRKSILWVLLVASIYGAYDYYQKHLPCAQPITYSLGTFDTQFGISREDFLTRIKDAGDIWSKARGRELFVYDPKADLKINLIYDSRQQVSAQNRALISNVDKNKKTAESIKAEYTKLEAEYKLMEAEYKKNRTESQRIALNNLAAQINQKIKDYNNLVGEINGVVKTINQSAGLEFDEGEYIYDSTGERIDIYEFSGKTDLKRVLAHELGHALGLEHVENEASIMYYLNRSTNTAATKEDKTELERACNQKPSIY